MRKTGRGGKRDKVFSLCNTDICPHQLGHQLVHYWLAESSPPFGWRNPVLLLAGRIQFSYWLAESSPPVGWWNPVLLLTGGIQSSYWLAESCPPIGWRNPVLLLTGGIQPSYWLAESSPPIGWRNPVLLLAGGITCPRNNDKKLMPKVEGNTFKKKFPCFHLKKTVKFTEKTE